MGGKLTGVFDEVSPNSDADAVWVILLRAVVDNNSRVGDLPVLWDGSNFRVSEKTNSVCTFFLTVTLRYIP